MTATRWWVKILARWIAKIDGTSGFARLGLLAVTGFSTFGSMLSDYGFESFFVPFVIGGTVGFIIFTELFTEGGVWNQVMRDKSDLSKNYATPFQRISNEMTARAFYAGQVGRELTDDEREAISNEIQEAFDEMRDGIEIEKENR